MRCYDHGVTAARPRPPAGVTTAIGPSAAPAPFARVLAVAILTTSIGLIPPMLLASLIVFLRVDLDFGEQGLGVASAVFFGAGALVSVPAGRLVERLGPRRAVLLGSGGSATCLLGIGFVARSWLALVAFLCLGGMAVALSQPGADLTLARGVPSGRQGVAFGAKHTAGSLAVLTAGLAVPVLGVTLGWRWAFALIALLVLPIAILLPRNLSNVRGPAARRVEAVAARPPTRADPPVRGLVVLSLAAGLASGSANAAAAFLVAYAVDAGVATSTAGLLLTIGGTIGGTSRIFMGWLADRRSGHHFAVCTGLVAVGAVGYLLLAFAGNAVTFAIGSVLALGIGWSWHGLFVYAVVRSHQHAPAAATGIAQLGPFVGGVAVPIALGAATVRFGFRPAWLGLSVCAVAAAGLMALGADLLRNDLRLHAEGAIAPAPA